MSKLAVAPPQLRVLLFGGGARLVTALPFGVERPSAAVSFALVCDQGSLEQLSDRPTRGEVKTYR